MNKAKGSIIDGKLHIIGTNYKSFYHLISDIKESGKETAFVESKGTESMNYINILENFELIYVKPLTINGVWWV